MSPPPAPKVVLAKLEEIETELKHSGFWQAEPLKAEQYDFKAAFGMDRMTFSQWLQFVFLPRVKEAATQEQFPSESNVAAQAVREFDGVVEADLLISLLSEFDALFQ
jgi:uncharacterized protein YqcC (DUF446 family)